MRPRAGGRRSGPHPFASKNSPRAMRARWMLEFVAAGHGGNRFGPPMPFPLSGGRRSEPEAHDLLPPKFFGQALAKGVGPCLVDHRHEWPLRFEAQEGEFLPTPPASYDDDVHRVSPPNFGTGAGYPAGPCSTIGERLDDEDRRIVFGPHSEWQLSPGPSFPGARSICDVASSTCTSSVAPLRRREWNTSASRKTIALAVFSSGCHLVHRLRHQPRDPLVVAVGGRASPRPRAEHACPDRDRRSRSC